jgi:hypothetical protein
MIIAVVGIFMGYPMLVGAAITTVGVDQLMFYVDALGYFIMGKFYVGAAKCKSAAAVCVLLLAPCLNSPPTCMLWSGLVGCRYGGAGLFDGDAPHFAAPPLVPAGLLLGGVGLRVCAPVHSAAGCSAHHFPGGMRSAATNTPSAPPSTPLSAAPFMLLTCLTLCLPCAVQIWCRILTPHKVRLPPSERRRLGVSHRVINVNFAFGFWADVPIAFLHYCDHQPPHIYLLYLTVVGNAFLNATPYVLFRLFSPV